MVKKERNAELHNLHSPANIIRRSNQERDDVGCMARCGGGGRLSSKKVNRQKSR
jgi:hypothetical protein